MILGGEGNAVLVVGDNTNNGGKRECSIGSNCFHVPVLRAPPYKDKPPVIATLLFIRVIKME
jgi:hypothetical protein